MGKALLCNLVYSTAATPAFVPPTSLCWPVIALCLFTHLAPTPSGFSSNVNLLWQVFRASPITSHCFGLFFIAPIIARNDRDRQMVRLFFSSPTPERKLADTQLWLLYCRQPQPLVG